MSGQRPRPHRRQVDDERAVGCCRTPYSLWHKVIGGRCRRVTGRQCGSRNAEQLGARCDVLDGRAAYPPRERRPRLTHPRPLQQGGERGDVRVARERDRDRPVSRGEQSRSAAGRSRPSAAQSCDRRSLTEQFSTVHLHVAPQPVPQQANRQQRATGPARHRTPG
jgi:hypothetical protein